MSDFYSGLAQTALRLLQEYGQPMTLTRRTAGAYNPATGAATITSTTADAQGAIFDIRGKEFDPQMVQVGDRKIIMAAVGLDFAPEPGMHVTVGADEWSVVQAGAINPGAVDVIYKLQVRK